MIQPSTQPVFDARPSTGWMPSALSGVGPGIWCRLCLLVILASYLSATVMVAAESWHRVVHEDEGHPDHQCLITLLQSGQFMADGVSEVAVPLPALRDRTASFVVRGVPAREMTGLHYGRAPPVSFSFPRSFR